jgi:hypothetical protein
LRYAPVNVGEIVVACCILHNAAIDYGDNMQPDENLLPQNEGNINIPAENVSGLAFRNAFIAQHF